MMKSTDLHAKPQREEGFIEAKYIHLDKVADLLKYDDEREIVKVALEIIKKEEK